MIWVSLQFSSSKLLSLFLNSAWYLVFSTKSRTFSATNFLPHLSNSSICSATFCRDSRAFWLFAIDSKTFRRDYWSTNEIWRRGCCGRSRLGSVRDRLRDVSLRLRLRGLRREWGGGLKGWERLGAWVFGLVGRLVTVWSSTFLKLILIYIPIM